MVYYFVIGSDSNRYGPADIDTLVQWAREGRIVSTTVLIERGTDRQIVAAALTAVASELRRHGDRNAAVSIERDIPGVPENPMHAPTIPQIPTAMGAVPPLPYPPILPYGPPQRVGRRSRLTAGLLGIFLGGLGAHRFYLGYIGIGLLQLFLTIITVGWAGIWGFVEGIICLAGGMRDADGNELRT